MRDDDRQFELDIVMPVSATSVLPERGAPPALPLSLRVLVRSARRLVIATQAAIGAADPI
jgi:hypothetical protein